MRLPLPALLLACGVLLGAGAAAPVLAADTLVWVGVRAGLMYYNEVDPDDLEQLATALSGDRELNPSAPINFDEKGWEIPFGLELGLRLSDSINVWGFFQRMPYTLEGPLPETNGSFRFPIDSVRLDLPANVIGGGLDFRLGSRGYGSSLLLGVELGVFDAEGGDQDIQGFRNFLLEASGTFWQVSLKAELDFSSELTFYPFLSFQGTSTDEAVATLLPRGGVSNDVDIPRFDVDYMAVTIGISVRFRVYPFDTEGDPERGEVE